MNPNELKLGQYKVLNLLGKGGMATVYLGKHQTLGKKVAIKILNDDLTHNLNIRNRFLSEAKSMANMSHPNIIPVIDLIEDDNNVAFVMEYVEGKTLKEYLATKGGLSNAVIKVLLSQITSALKYVHDRGLIHRDIKPSNLMISTEGKIKLLDFGIAKNIDTSITDYTQTRTTQQMGTPMYMSPEQIKSTKHVTAHTDIYSLGVLLWQLVKGVAPYNTSSISTFELQTQIVNAPLPLTHTIWDSIIQKATAKLPSDRYTGMDKMMLAVEQIEAKKSNSDKTTIVQNRSKKNDTNAPKDGIKGNTVFETMYYIVLLSIVGFIDGIWNKVSGFSWLVILELLLTIRVLYGFNQYLVKYLNFRKSTFSTYIFMSAIVVFPIFHLVGENMSFNRYTSPSTKQISFIVGALLYGIVFIYAAFRLFINLFLVKGAGIIYFRIIGILIFLTMLAVGVMIVMEKDLVFEQTEPLDYLFSLIFDGILFMGFWKAYQAFGSAQKTSLN